MLLSGQKRPEVAPCRTEPQPKSQRACEKASDCFLSSLSIDASQRDALREKAAVVRNRCCKKTFSARVWKCRAREVTPIVRDASELRMRMKRHPRTGCTAMRGTAEIPIPAETNAKIVANWPLSNTMLGETFDFLHASIVLSRKQCPSLSSKKRLSFGISSSRMDLREANGWAVGMTREKGSWKSTVEERSALSRGRAAIARSIEPACSRSIKTGVVSSTMLMVIAGCRREKLPRTEGSK